MSKDVATRMETAPVEAAPVSESAAILQVIERAAMNPDVDIDKMERLLNMQERIMARNARSAYYEALAEMQPSLPTIGERGKIEVNKVVRSTYALWEDINDAIKPVLARHGFSLSFRTGQGDGKIIVTGVLGHREGHSEETTMELPVDASGAKNPVQAVGSSTSYGKRYVASALLNLTSRNEDDDGSGGDSITISEDQYTVLANLMTEVGADKGRFERFLKVESLSDLPANRFEDARKALEAKRKGPNA
jgi:hypothetical protein